MEIPNLSTNTPLVKDATPNPTPYNNDMKREHESVDDFEHLEISPSKEKSNIISDSLLNLGTDKDLPAPSNNVCSQPNLLDQSNNFHPFSQHEDSSKDIISGLNEKSMFSSKSENLDDFSKHSSFEKPSSSVGFEVSKFLEAETSDFKKPATDDNSDYFSKFSMDNSDTVIPEVKDSTMKDSSPEIGDFKHDKIIEHDFLNEPSNATNQNDKLIDVTPGKSFEKSLTPEPSANENQIEQKEPKPDPFELMSEKHTSQPEPQVPSIPITPSKPDPIAKDVPVSTNIVSVPKTNSDSIKSTPDKSASSGKFSTKEEAPVKVPDSLPIKKPDVFSKTESDDSEIIKVDEVFRRIGLDSWFKPETLHPQVEALVYWRDPKKSGAVFGTILVALLSLTYYSFISVVAYFSLIILSGTISFKIYKSILQAVQKTSDGHPFKEILEMELTLPQEKVREVTDTAVAHFNAAVIELRRLFLVEDLVDSIKFAVLLWLLTRVGAWFNGMTLIIIAFIALFSVPKVYENNKAQVDANLAIVQSKLQEITTKVKAALPIGKKEADKDKEQ